jgi:hypothetical protein
MPRCSGWQLPAQQGRSQVVPTVSFGLFRKVGREVPWFGPLRSDQAAVSSLGSTCLLCPCPFIGCLSRVHEEFVRVAAQGLTGGSLIAHPSGRRTVVDQATDRASPPLKMDVVIQHGPTGTWSKATDDDRSVKAYALTLSHCGAH